MRNEIQICIKRKPLPRAGEILKRLKRKVVSFFTRPHIAVQMKAKIKRLGNDAGDFFVAEDLLPENPIVFSFGVGTDTSFDEEMMERYHARIFAFDPTPKAIEWVKNRHYKKEFSFFPVGLAHEDGEAEFFLPKNPEHVSGSTDFHSSNVSTNNRIKVPMKTIQTLIQEIKPERIDIIKLDIEGSEFTVIDDILEYAPCRQILMEIHYIFYQDGKERLLDMVKKLNVKGYYLVAKTESMDVFTFAQKGGVISDQ